VKDIEERVEVVERRGWNDVFLYELCPRITSDERAGARVLWNTKVVNSTVAERNPNHLAPRWRALFASWRDSITSSCYIMTALTASSKNRGESSCSGLGTRIYKAFISETFPFADRFASVYSSGSRLLA
jgi:hypothetical protein